MTEHGPNGKPVMRDYVVTYRFDCYENVRATSTEDAAAKVERAMAKIPGRRTIEITNVEEA